MTDTTSTSALLASTWTQNCGRRQSHGGPTKLQSQMKLQSSFQKLSRIWKFHRSCIGLTKYEFLKSDLSWGRFFNRLPPAVQEHTTLCYFSGPGGSIQYNTGRPRPYDRQQDCCVCTLLETPMIPRA